MGVWGWIILGAAAWVGCAAVARWIMAAAVRPDSFETGFLVRLYQVYARLVHRLRIEGAHHIPHPRSPGEGVGPLIVVANHTAGVDPILIQATVPFEPRWMMASDMRAPLLEALWEFGRIIFVDRRGGDAPALREGLRHLASGGALGVFPEGHLERPARHILPFQPGVGLLIGRSKARVLPVVIDGTPICDPAWGSLVKPSHSRIRFLAPIDYSTTGLGPAEIAADLHRRFIDATGWPAWDRPPRLVDDQWVWDTPAPGGTEPDNP